MVGDFNPGFHLNLTELRCKHHRVYSAALTSNLGGKKPSIPSEHSWLCVKNEANHSRVFYKTKQQPPQPLPCPSNIVQIMIVSFYRMTRVRATPCVCSRFLHILETETKTKVDGHPCGCLVLSVASEKMLERPQET